MAQQFNNFRCKSDLIPYTKKNIGLFENIGMQFRYSGYVMMVSSLFRIARAE